MEEQRTTLIVRRKDGARLKNLFQELMLLLKDPQDYFWKLYGVEAYYSDKTHEFVKSRYGINNIFDFESVINDPGLHITFRDLTVLISSLDDIINIELYGDKERENLTTPIPDPFLNLNFKTEYMIGVIDSSFCEVSSTSKSYMHSVRSAFETEDV